MDAIDLRHRHRIKTFFIKKTINQFFLHKRECAHLELKETKNITHYILLKAHPHKRYQSSFVL